MEEVRKRVLRWYARRGRRLPWRTSGDPYAVLVSELMLQQTQVSRVVPAYARFLRRFPTLERLASASLGDVLREWAGLGYDRRARYLWLAARAHPHALPRDVSSLDALAGVGTYTACAVACFAGGQAVPFADTNIRRVLGRVSLGRGASEREANALDAALLSRRVPDRWHHALMDLGATVCLARAPRCEVCPLRRQCRFARGPRVTEPTRRKQSPFVTSDRRVRGRIMASLRDAPRGVTLVTLSRVLADRRVPGLVARLEREGLVERARGRVRLPT